jgi:hypothetical protein
VHTIIEKLKREKTRLSAMQDIAGVRVVLPMTLGEQDALVERIPATATAPFMSLRQSAIALSKSR